MTSNPVSATLPVLPADPPREALLVRAKQMRDEFALLNIRVPFTGRSLRQDSARIRRQAPYSSEFRSISSDNLDIVLDWAKQNPQKFKPFEGQLNALTSLLAQEDKFDSNTRDEKLWDLHRNRKNQLDEISKNIVAQITEAPWSSWDWFEVFGERWSALEWTLHQRLNIPLYEVQQFIRLVFAPITHEGYDRLARSMLMGDPVASLYSKANIQEVIELAKPFAPRLAKSLEDAHLGLSPKGHWLYQAERVSHYFHNVGVKEPGGMWPDIRRITPREVRDDWWELTSLEDFLDRHLNEFKTLLMDLQGSRDILVQLPESPVRDLLIRETQNIIEQAETELATLPNRLAAERWRAQAYRTRSREIGELTQNNVHLLNEYMEELNAMTPKWNSKAWQTFQPPQIEFDKKVHPDAQPLSHLNSVEANLKWIERLSNDGVKFSQNLLSTLTTIEKIAAAIPMDKPKTETNCEKLVASLDIPQIEHKPAVETTLPSSSAREYSSYK